MTLRRYAYYPASPESVRGAAGGVRDGSSNLHALIQRVDRQHRAVVGSTQGDLVGPLGQSIVGPHRLASAVSRRALWAAAQLEVFADAIEVYNRDSSDPMSIEKLNQLVDQASPAYFCLSVPGPDAAERDSFNRQYQTRLAAHQIELDTHFVRLEANLDIAAGEAAAALRREPSDADVVALWKAGNLPAYAALAWPELNLRGIPISGIDQDLFDLSEQQIVELLKDPTRALSDAELEWLAVSYPEAMRRFHEQWTLQDTVLLPSDQPPAGVEPGSSKHGWILGPDGRWYPIQIPEAAKLPPGSGPVVGEMPGGLHNGNGDWVTLDSRQGRIYLGEPPPTALLILSGMTGYTPNIYGNLSVGENQTDYLTYDQYGNVYAHQQATDRGPAWSPPPSVPEPELGQAPPGTWDPAATDNPALDRLNRVSSLVDLGVGGLKGLQLSNQIDANNSYAGNVVFQTSGDDRRAVIQVAQVTYDPETGKVESDPYRRYATAEDLNQELSGDLDAPAPMPTPIPTDLPVPELTEPGPQPGPPPTPPR